MANSQTLISDISLQGSLIEPQVRVLAAVVVDQ